MYFEVFNGQIVPKIWVSQKTSKLEIQVLAVDRQEKRQPEGTAGKVESHRLTPENSATSHIKEVLFLHKDVKFLFLPEKSSLPLLKKLFS